MANWDGVNEFVAVGQTLSFTKAALKLNTSVAQISRKVGALESRLATKLLNRTTRSVALTDAGKSYFYQCQALNEALEQAELSVTQMQRTVKGLIRITAPVTYGEQKLAPLLYSFLLHYPELELDLHLSNQKLDMHEQGFDLAVRLGTLTDSSLIARKLAPRQLFVCASPNYLKARGQPHTLNELKHHQCLVGSVNQWRFAQDQKTRLLSVSGRVKCNSGFALLNAAKQDLGLVQLPDYYVGDALRSGALKEVLSQYKDDREGVWALYPSKQHLSSKVRLLIDYLVANI
ncbi:LysR family transcriptional regulator [Alginatibacterium sediminis]|uniref:LysR family transcriptional regulator n=1 Tax=Alginatibacterium sediminis TaxID=2164068 RepID=A0A420E9R6_9ALTE|nr:LysR substrate-binding domain-containing protein [Alginatibacterium sediminis]RKF17419.1 LysR family transcriptional regulator [Alginatibacterium sediminis]